MTGFSLPVSFVAIASRNTKAIHTPTSSPRRKHLPYEKETSCAKNKRKMSFSLVHELGLTLHQQFSPRTFLNEAESAMVSAALPWFPLSFVVQEASTLFNGETVHYF